ncbi:pentatricopeptide repeat-containing protein At2g13600-like [Aristolochia californica]|uniref:pentatricopeptide repeat-containing protein At2g13600-like n=1 Tax=Aristolochia californica TaxID=171875 RepID=UPI0035E226A6
MQRVSICARIILSRPLHNLPFQQQSLEQDLHLFSQEGRLKDAIRILQRENSPKIRVHPETYLRLIRSCIKFKAFKEGREIHKHMVENGFQPDVTLRNHLITLYYKSGEQSFAHELFDKMGERNLFSWTAIIGGCMNVGESTQAFEFYEKMIFTGLRADRFLYPLILKSCGKMRDSRKGRRIHVNVIKSGFQWDVVVMNSLVDMYSKCECMVDAEKVFCEMDFRDSFTWTTMLVGYVQACYSEDALDFFRRMMNVEVRPCSAIFAGILPIFSHSGSLDLAKQIHGLIAVSGFESDKFVGSGLVDMYTNCGGLGYGHLIFERVKERDTACWNAMIKGYSQVGLFDEAIKLLIQMHDNQVNPNKATWECLMAAVVQSGSIDNILGITKRLESGGVRPNYLSISSLLQMCESPDVVQYVKELQQYLGKEGYLSDKTMISLFLNFYLKFADFEAALDIFNSIEEKELGDWNSMISSYANYSQANNALELFDSMRKDGIEPDILSWNSVIDGLVRNYDFKGAMEIFEEMKWSKQRPDSTSFEIILPVLASLTSLRTGKELHNIFLRHGYKMNHYISTALMNMYGNCGDTHYAAKIFNSMNSKDIVSWNTLITVLAKNGFLDEALKTFKNMEMEGEKANIITWTSLISAHVQNGQVDESFKYFRQLQSHGLKPNSITIACILSACALSATLSHGKAIHGYSIRSMATYNDFFLVNSLMDMFIKCGSFTYAERIFRTHTHRDIITWNTMITGYSIHGKSHSSLALFNEMLNEAILPDSVTFVGVLSACSHAGLIDEGWKQFNSMSSVYGIVPTGKHYACMVDLLGRAGHFENARNFIIQMPLQPTASLWGALLSSAKTYGNVEMAEYAARHLLELQPDDPGNYVILSNIYASQERWNDVDRLRNMMLDYGVKKQPGCSWIEVRNRVHAFTVENPSHPYMEEISKTLHDLVTAMWEEGYLLDTPTDWFI